MKASRFIRILLGSLAPLSTASASLTDQLLAYYNFEETGDAGLANKVPGATGFNATRGGTSAAYTEWGAGANGTGPGFAGNPSYQGVASGASDRSVLFNGKALNLDDDRNEYVAIPLGTAELGTSFTVSMWHNLTPGATNASGRYHLFEAAENYDISWGTQSTSNTTPQDAYTYFSYIGSGSSSGPSGVLSRAWHHVALCVTSDGTTTTLRTYLDGVLVATQTTATANMSFTSLVLGRQRTSDTSDREWDGMVDEFAVWNRRLSANEVTEIYQRGRAGFNLVADLAAANKAFVSVETSDEVLGETLGTGLYDVGAEINVAALPRDGSLFTGWSAPFTGRPNDFPHTVTASVHATAGFVQDTADDDNDGLTNYQEIVTYLTLPDNPDSDGDGIPDGAEVFTTRTDPNSSQATVVTYVQDHFPGGVGPKDVALPRNSSSGSVTIKVKPVSSTTLTGWDPVTPATPGVSNGASGGVFQLTLPAAGDSKRFFKVGAGK